MNKTLTIGNEFTVNRIGLGTNRIRENDQSQQTLLSAKEIGINFIDTAAAYTGGESEKMIGKTFSPKPQNLIVATKGGMMPPDFHVDGRIETLEKQLESSLISLKTDCIDIYFLHKPDPNVPFEDQINFLKNAQENEKIKHIGLSNVSLEQLEEARKTIKVVAVENQYNLSNREEDNVIDYCEREEIVFIPFFPLHGTSASLTSLAQKYNATQEQIQLAWLLKRSPIMLPIPGSLSKEHLRQNFEALNIDLITNDFEKLQNENI